jgi:hypothetical protein
MRGGALGEELAPDLAAMRRQKTMENKIVFILSENDESRKIPHFSEGK